MNQNGEKRVNAQVGEMVRFVIVGCMAVATDFLVYFALVYLVPVIPIPVSKATSFAAGASLAFVLNRKVVFRAGERKASSQVIPFAVLYLLTLGLNTLTNSVLLALGATKPLAWLFATGASTISNYLGMKFVVFRKVRPRESLSL
ncbi:MAG: GtrA family protein [Candidatus Eisenbacteria bacterium]|nr:GtrA family protein [Candidatus Eisenbacteria bacterium]